MSNIHGLNNYNSNNRSQRYPMMGGSNNPTGDPRNETFSQFLKDFCCPTFVFKSVIFSVSIIDVIIYIITLCYGIQPNPNELLAPLTTTLDNFGMKNYEKIKQGQVWRLVTFALLHANFMHLVVNIFSQIIIGSNIETMIGSLKTSAIYLFSSIGGGIFSCIVSRNNGVGASVSIYGLLGAYVNLF